MLPETTTQHDGNRAAAVAPGTTGDRVSRLGRTALVLTAFVLLTALFYNLGRRVYSGDSDVATLVLQGQAIDAGHFALNGWRMVFDSFWTIEVPFYALGVAAFGVRPFLFYLIPAAFAALVVLVGCWLARDGRRGWPGGISVGVVFVLLALPSGAWAVTFLRSGWHVATVLWCLLAYAGVRSGRWGYGWVVAVVFLAAGILGDLQTLALGVVPVFAAGVVTMLRTQSWRASLPAVTAAAAGTALAVAVRELGHLVGIYTIGEGNPRASLHQVLANASHIPSWVAAAFGATAGPFGTSNVSLPLRAVHVVGLLLVIAAIVGALISLIAGVIRGRSRPETRLDDLLVLGCCADLAFFVGATLSDDQGYLRYLTPLVIFGSILAGRFAGRWLPAVSRRRIAAMTSGAVAAAVVALFAVGTAQLSARPTPQLTAQQLSRFLEQHGLRSGIGAYWDSSIVTAVSGDRAVVRPVAGGPAGTIVRYGKQSADYWYDGKSFRFLVYDDGPQSPGVDAASATRTFGPPAQSYTVGGYHVLVWSHPVQVPASPSGP